MPKDNSSEVLSMEEMLINFGDAVKLLEPVKELDDGAKQVRIGGYLVLFSTKEQPDLEGDFFTKNTDYGIQTRTPILYHHGFDPVMKDRVLGVADIKIDEAGVWLEGQLELRDEYEKMVLELILAGKLGWSSGTAGHLVKRERSINSWKITAWPLGLDASMTPTPAEPRTHVQDLKSYLNSLQLHFTNPGANDKAPKEGTEMKKKDNTVPVVEQEPTPASEPQTAPPQPVVKEPVSEPAPAEQPAEPASVVVDQGLADAVAAKVLEKFDPPQPFRSAPVVVNQENLGDPDPYLKLTEWLKGADNVKGLGAIGAKKVSDHELGFGIDGIYGKSYKAALQEGTASEGGHLVPNDFFAGIIAKRDQMSIARRAGARIFRTSRDVLDIPTEDTSLTNFTLTNEEAAYNQNEPTFGNAQVTIYKFTKVQKVSEELIEDEAANLDSFLMDAIGRAWGLTENNYTLVGTGSSQPQGVFVGGSVGYTFADTNSITAAEIPSLYWTLGDPYHDGSVWVTRGATMGSLQGLTGNNFQLIQTPPSDLGGMNLWYKPVYISDSAAALATGAKTIIFGNWNYYALVERHGLIIQRNPYLYQANGQIGIFSKVRFGGIVLQSEAFKWGIQA